MSSRPEPNENPALLNPSISPEWPELLASAALVIQTVVNDSDECLREAIRQHEKRAAQLEEEINRHKEKMGRHKEKLGWHEEKMDRYKEKIAQHKKKIQHPEMEDPYIKKEVEQYRKEVEQYRKEVDRYRKEAEQYREGASQYRRELEYGSQLRDQAEARGLPFEDLYPGLTASGFSIRRPLKSPSQQPAKRLGRNIPTQKRSRETTVCSLVRNLLQRLYQLLLSLRRCLHGRPPSVLPGNHKVRASQQQRLFSASATPKPASKQEPAPIQAECRAAGA